MKFLTISIMIIGIIILFNAGGIETPSGGIVKQFLDGGLSTFTTSTFWLSIKEILTLGVGTIVIAGLITRSAPESYVSAGFIWLIGGVILTDMMTVYTILWNSGIVWIRWVTTALFIPLFYSFMVSVLSFWRGSDY